MGDRSLSDYVGLGCLLWQSQPCIFGWKKQMIMRLTYEFSVSPAIKKQVLWFEVPIDNCFWMQITDGLNNTRAVETCCRVVERVPTKPILHAINCLCLCCYVPYNVMYRMMFFWLCACRLFSVFLSLLCNYFVMYCMICSVLRLDEIKIYIIYKCYRLTHRKQQKIVTVNLVVEHIVTTPMCSETKFTVPIFCCFRCVSL